MHVLEHLRAKRSCGRIWSSAMHSQAPQLCQLSTTPAVVRFFAGKVIASWRRDLMDESGTTRQAPKSAPNRARGFEVETLAKC